MSKNVFSSSLQTAAGTKQLSTDTAKKMTNVLLWKPKVVMASNGDVFSRFFSKTPLLLLRPRVLAAHPKDCRGTLLISLLPCLLLLQNARHSLVAADRDFFWAVTQRQRLENHVSILSFGTHRLLHPLDVPNILDILPGFCCLLYTSDAADE